jgi:uridine kinase
MAKLTSRIDGLLSLKSIVVCAIDGPCASGKSTLAARLESMYGCNVVHMDDFFPQPWQRTAERLAEPGGNIDRERFLAEALGPLLEGRAVRYRRFDCSVQALAEEILLRPNALNIIEGAYSLHPALRGAYDLKAFLTVDSEEQKARLLKRNPESYPRFMEEWVPKENKYFEAFKVAECCDLILEG